MYNYLLIIISFLLSYILLKIIISFAYQKRIFDSNGGRKIHHGNIPRVGGMAFVPAAVVSFSVILVILYSKNSTITGVHGDFFFESLIVLSSILLIYLFGLYDDINGLRYRNKFSYQIFVGLFICFAGIYMKDIHGLMALYNIPPAFGHFVTIFLLVLSINAFNFIDGIDGLSSGIAIISLGYFTIILYLNDNLFYLLSLSFLFALLPFFYFNVFGKEKKRSKSFMGDTGSTVLGVLLFIFAILVNEDINSKQFNVNPFILGFSPFLLPFYDVFSVVFYRMLKGKNPFLADDNHFHHKLLKLGLSQHMALIVELFVFLFITYISIFLVKYINLNVLMALSLMLWVGINILIERKIEKNKSQIITR